MHRGFVVALALFGTFMILYHAHAWWRSRGAPPMAVAVPDKVSAQDVDYGLPTRTSTVTLGNLGLLRDYTTEVTPSMGNLGGYTVASSSSSAAAQAASVPSMNMGANVLRGLTVSSRSVSEFPNNSLTLFR
jgi:hypothetical protein